MLSSISTQRIGQSLYRDGKKNVDLKRKKTKKYINFAWMGDAKCIVRIALRAVFSVTVWRNYKWPLPSPSRLKQPIT